MFSWFFVSELGKTGLISRGSACPFFNSKVENGKAQKLHTYTLTQETIVNENVDYSKNITVFNIISMGFGDTFNVSGSTIAVRCL